MNTCNQYFSTKDYVSCEALADNLENICETLKPVLDWGQRAIAQTTTTGQWIWDETEKAYGPIGQILLIASITFFAYKVFGSSKKDNPSLRKREIHQMVDRRMCDWRVQKKPLHNRYKTW